MTISIPYEEIHISSTEIRLDHEAGPIYLFRMFTDLAQIPSPAVLIDADAMEKNLRRMQGACDAGGVELWPHIKTHKMIPILHRQLELGAKGATCAKIGEAEALLPSGVRRIFIANSLADLRQAPRLKALQTKLDQLILAVTSEPHFEALEKILSAANISVPVLMAVDTGLGREGARSLQQAAELAANIRKCSHMQLLGLYTHEGQSYGASSMKEAGEYAARVHAKLQEFVEAVGGNLELWPGCSVTAAIMAGRPGIKAVRPGSYVFGDLALTETTGLMAFNEAALTILATVVDRPEENLALVDAGSKVFSSDKTPKGITGRCQDFPDLTVIRCNEEHGYMIGEGVNNLQIGQRLRIQPAHVCTVVNLANHVRLVRGNQILETWPVDARGRSD